jgi:hypothetical protein
MTFKFAHSLTDLKHACKRNEIEIITKVVAPFYSNQSVNIKCKKCNNRLNRWRKAWRYPLGKIITAKISCSKCSGNQSLSAIQFSKTLKTYKLNLVGAKKYFLKSKIKVRCTVCKNVFSTCLDTIRANKGRPCKCNKHCWGHFENLVREVYGGEKLKIAPSAYPDCVLQKQKIIIDAKYGNVAFQDFKRGSNSRDNQKSKYVSTGFRVYYVCCLPKERMKVRKNPRIKYVFLEDLMKVKINGRAFSKRQYKSAKRMFEFPWEFSTRAIPEDYATLKEDYALISVLNGGFCPSSKSAEHMLEVSYQKICDAFNLTPASDNSLRLASAAAKAIGKKKRFRTHREHIHFNNIQRLSRFVWERYRGLVMSHSHLSRTVHFKCRIPDHPIFRLRPDKVLSTKINRWCRLCRKPSEAVIAEL